MQEIYKIILLLETSQEVDRALCRGIAKYSRLHGPWAFYTSIGGIDRALPKLDLWKADGIIAHVPNQKIADSIIKAKKPTITKGMAIEGCPHIRGDSKAIGKMGAEYMLKRKLKNFAYCGFSEKPWSKECWENFNRTIKKAGHTAFFFQSPLFSDENNKTRSSYCRENSQATLFEWLKSLPKPVGIMACNDDRARHVIEACKIADIHVPDKISVLGVDNDPQVCELSFPPLTSISLNIEKAGYEAAETIDRLISGQNRKREYIIVRPTHVVSRLSTDFLMIEDELVLNAIRFINSHAKNLIQVDDVVDNVSISRRVLEKRFMNTLGTSILKEIATARIDYISKMLVETHQSITQIAESMGYESQKHFSRIFKREKGLTPLAYRKIYG